jgi:O-antigen/teichoic acid export membrane protein
MSALITVIALASVMFVFAYMSFKVNPDKNNLNYALQIFFFFVSLLCVVMIAGTTLANNQNCEYVATNTTISGGTYLENSYTYTCTPSTDGTPQAFFYIAVGVFSIFMMYVLVGVFYYAIDKLKESGKL